ncbi:hypothetical protein FRB93_004550 [Tulasnella sp. JGI-2019a]|nr:hypothetical protein FRB93_004550 [Tulasnella sp. JGI-2019a]
MSSRRPTTAPASTSQPSSSRLPTQPQKSEKRQWRHHHRHDQQPLQEPRALRGTDDTPPSPISFAEWKESEDELFSILHGGVAQELPLDHHLGRYDLVQATSERHGLDAKTDHDSTTRAAPGSYFVDTESTPPPRPRRKSIFKRMFKEWTGSSSKEGQDATRAPPVGFHKEKSSTFGRGGAAKFVSTSVNSFSMDDDTRSLKSVTSSVANHLEKKPKKQPVFDPYLKAFVDLKGEVVPPVPSISRHTRDAYSTSSIARIQTAESSNTSPSLSLGGRSRAASTTTYTDVTTFSDWAHSTPPHTANSSVWDNVSFTREPNTPLKSAFRGTRSKKHSVDPEGRLLRSNAPPSSWTTPASSVPTSPVKRGFNRRPSNISLSQEAGKQPQSGLDSFIPSFAESDLAHQQPFTTSSVHDSSHFIPITPLPPGDLASLQALYTTLLSQPAAPQTTYPQPIIPPEMARNLDNVITIATSYQQALNTLTATLGNDPSSRLPPNFVGALPETHQQNLAPIPVLIPPTQTSALSLGVGPTIGRRDSVTRGNLSSSMTSSIGSTTSALSPPPRQLQAQMKRSGSVTGQASSEVQTRASSPEKGEARWLESVRKKTLRDLAMEEAKVVPIMPASPVLESRLSFSSSRSCSPEPPAIITVTRDEDSKPTSSNPRPPLLAFRTPSTLSGQHHLTPATSSVPLMSSPALSATDILRSEDEAQSAVTSSRCSTPESDHYHAFDEEATAKVDWKLLELLADEEQDEPASEFLIGDIESHWKLDIVSGSTGPSASPSPSRRGRLSEGDYRNRSLPPTPAMPHTPPRRPLHPSSDSPDSAPVSLPKSVNGRAPINQEKVLRNKPSAISLTKLRSLDLGRCTPALPSPFLAESPFTSSPLRSPQVGRPSPTVFNPVVTDYGFPLPPTGLPSLSPRKGATATAWKAPVRSMRTRGHTLPQELRG